MRKARSRATFAPERIRLDKLPVRSEADAETWRVAKEMLASFAGNE